MKSIFRSASLGSLIAVLCLTLTVLPLAGCSEQQTTANIVTDLGDAVAAVLTIEGNNTSATQLLQDTQAASAQILAWTTGTPTQNVEEVIALVVKDISLLPIPVSPTDQALIQIAASLANQLLSQFGAAAPVTPAGTVGAHFMTASKPSGKLLPLSNAQLKRMHKDFKARWNAVVLHDPSRAKARIK